MRIQVAIKKTCKEAVMRRLIRVGRVLWCMAIFMCLFSAQVLGQAVGAIVGAITGSSGAVVPGAKVTAVRVETKASRFTLTSNTGSFTIFNLIP